VVGGARELDDPPEVGDTAARRGPPRRPAVRVAFRRLVQIGGRVAVVSRLTSSVDARLGYRVWP